MQRVEFLTNVSHEMRTPMNAIVGMAELLSETVLDNQQKRHLETIRSAGDQLLTIIDDVLDLSSIESGHARLDALVFDLRAVASDTTAFLLARATYKRLSLTCDVASTVPGHVVGDARRVRQVAISVDSRVGVGSTFRFTLKLPASAPAPRAPSVSVSPRADAELRVLLADDSEDNRRLIQAYLRETSWQLDMAENGAVAVEKFAGEAYDLVLMDIQMPVMDGYAATRALRALEQERGVRRVPIVALTANGLPQDAERAIEVGCTTHLLKPIRKHALLTTIRRLVRAGSTPAPPPTRP